VKSKVFKIAVLAVILALAMVYYVFDPSTAFLFPRCPFRLLTHIPCPGCGSQRALHCLLHADFAGAMHYNALMLLLIPVLLVLAAASLLKDRCPRLQSITRHRYVGYALVALILLWWILRIIFGWYV